jgi:uncharacterized protein
VIRGWAAWLLLLAAWSLPAAAQEFPALTGRVVDRAELLSPEQEAALTQRLAALEQATTRQLVVATVPSLQDYPIEDYAYRLGRHWRIGQAGADNGLVLLVAPNERKVRIEVGYGLEGIVPDALAGRIVRERILPRFRDNDYPGGITAGVDALAQQLQAPPEVAERRAAEAATAAREGGGDFPWPLLFWLAVVAVIVIAGIARRAHGRRYRGNDWLWAPIILWGPGSGGGSSGWSGGGSWGGGGGGFGGFSGGGGSFGGGGASGSW